jgi:hypothetical protein
MTGTQTPTEQAVAFANDPRVFDAGAWAELVVGTHPEPTPGMLAAIERAQRAAREAMQARLDSQESCDTDGFLSQWSHGITSSQEKLRAQVLSHGGFAVFPTLFNRETGEQVRAKLVEGQFGFSWAFLDAKGRRTHRYLPDTRTGKRAKLWKEGFVVLGAWHPAKASIVGTGHGLSGNAWAATVQCDFDEREGAQLDSEAAA